jgi:hypothetical protein
VIIGLGHQRRQGKDAVADILVRLYGFRKMSFTLDGGLHDACMALDPIVECVVEWTDPSPTVLHEGYWAKRFVRYSDAVNELSYEGAKDRYPEVVRTLQRMGTEVGRQHLGKYIGTPDIWVDIAMAAANEYGGDVVFTNVRFNNEAQKIIDAGGCVWKIERPGFELKDSVDIAQHVSESSISDDIWDEFLINNGTLEDLERLVIMVMKRYNRFDHEGKVHA